VIVNSLEMFTALQTAADFGYGGVRPDLAVRGMMRSSIVTGE
jgi:hypothetical protein